ncbi:hypothetical protein AXG93_1962s1740 [Marchantia polymorpha subsp. ruderalis]|uniref:Uncharacterized protein n=1 Tax=Marchantia polymorpha subsp. ruderalis TaxID=1480154 RepID=A0A176WDX0_MARPO|nr:hypothetical protein AXG93_1962s1740 [Marchantia polymorpha subsp. ruderalis]
MKAMRLILEVYNSTESRRVAARGRSVQETEPVAIAAREKEVSMGKKSQTIEEQPTPVKPQRASKKEKRKLKRAAAAKREWDSATAMTKEQVASLAAECAAAKATLQEREDQFGEKEIECEVLQLNLAKKSECCTELEEVCNTLRVTYKNAQKVTVDLCGRLEKFKKVYEAAVQRVERLITTARKREKMHVEELAKVEAQKAEEARIAEELQGKIAEAKTAEE